MPKKTVLMAFLALSAGWPVCSYAWEEDPRIEAHNKKTSELIALGDAQFNAKEHEKKEALKKEKENIETFMKKTTKRVINAAVKKSESAGNE